MTAKRLSIVLALDAKNITVHPLMFKGKDTSKGNVALFPTG